jgi:hypothetical protein
MVNQREVIENFEYKNGFLFWKIGRSGIQPGLQAGSKEKNGYYRIRFNGKKYLTHRLIFLMHNGFMPNFVDHADNNPENNCIENLREATRTQNNQNRKNAKNNKTGAKNVTWEKSANSWRVRININGVSKSFGCFKNIELAELVATEARNKFLKDFARHL